MCHKLITTTKIFIVNSSIITRTVADRTYILLIITNISGTVFNGVNINDLE